MLTRFFSNIEILKLLYESRSELLNIIINYQLEIYAWLLANTFISYITTFWLPLSTSDIYHSKDLLNTAYVIFVNAFLFSLLPDLSYKNKENSKNDEDDKQVISEDNSILKNISIIIKYLNITSIAIAVLIPFLLYKNLSFKINIICTIILLLFSFIHFALQSYWNKNDKPYIPRGNCFLAQSKISDDIPHRSNSGRFY